MFGFSAGEMLLIALIAILLFGNEKLPQNIKKFLKGWNRTKKVAYDLQKSWHEIKLDLKNNVESFEEHKDIEKTYVSSAKTENTNKIQTNISIKPVEHIVSQEEIDSYQEKH